MVVYVASRYSSKSEEEHLQYLSYTRSACREVALLEHEVVAPHILYTQFLRDDVESERELCMHLGKEALKKCDVLLVCLKYGNSDGIKSEMQFALNNNINIEVVREVSDIKAVLDGVSVKSCENCLHNETEQGEPFPMSCGECSRFYADGFESK